MIEPAALDVHMYFLGSETQAESALVFEATADQRATHDVGQAPAKNWEPEEARDPADSMESAPHIASRKNKAPVPRACSAWRQQDKVKDKRCVLEEKVLPEQQVSLKHLRSLRPKAPCASGCTEVG